MKKILLILTTIFLIGCEDKHELVIQEAAENCKCAAEIKRVHESKVSELLNNQRSLFPKRDMFSPSPSISAGIVKCDEPFYEEGESRQQYAKTKTLEIINKSETKVYEVMIQIKNAGKVSYENFKIEPTRDIILGCNFNFQANLDKVKSHERSLDIDLMELTNFSPIEYNIHKVTLLSEY